MTDEQLLKMSGKPRHFSDLPVWVVEDHNDVRSYINRYRSVSVYCEGPTLFLFCFSFLITFSMI